MFWHAFPEEKTLKCISFTTKSQTVILKDTAESEISVWRSSNFSKIKWLEPYHLHLFISIDAKNCLMMNYRRKIWEKLILRHKRDLWKSNFWTFVSSSSVFLRSICFHWKNPFQASQFTWRPSWLHPQAAIFYSCNSFLLIDWGEKNYLPSLCLIIYIMK